MINVNADLFRIAFSCVSTEEVRYYLNGVYVEPHPCGGAYLVSTNGHRLLCLYDAGATVDRAAIVRLDRPTLRACKPDRRARSYDARRLIVDNAGDARIMAHPANGSKPSQVASLAAVEIDGTFPDWRRVLPAVPEPGESDGQCPPAFNAAYVEAFGEIAADLATATGVGSRIIRIVHRDAASPALVLFPAVPIAFGVLMPVRDEVHVAMPAFMNARPYAVPVVGVTRPVQLGRRPWPHDDEPPQHGFAVTVARSPLHSTDRYEYRFPTRESAVRAFHRLLDSLQSRGMAKDVEREPMATKIPAEWLAAAQARATAIRSAVETFQAVNDDDLMMPWRRGFLAVPDDLPAKVAPLSVENTIRGLPHISEARALAHLYGRKAA